MFTPNAVSALFKLFPFYSNIISIIIQHNIILSLEPTFAKNVLNLLAIEKSDIDSTACTVNKLVALEDWCDFCLLVLCTHSGCLVRKLQVNHPGEQLSSQIAASAYHPERIACISMEPCTETRKQTSHP
jgi:hypothetical protein